MSRDLPARPNLDHLRKQAKQLLQKMKLPDPDSQLADAQHALAREYGFASWPRLKAHVEAETTAPNPFVGKWTADVSRSKLHPLNRLQAASLGFEIDGAHVTLDFVMVDESGRTDRAVNRFTADGNEHPSEHRDGYIMCAKWLGSHSLEAVVTRHGDGDFEGRVEYVVSPDGGTLTLSASWRGGVEQMSVFTRADL